MGIGIKATGKFEGKHRNEIPRMHRCGSAGNLPRGMRIEMHSIPSHMVGYALSRRAKPHNFNPGFSQQLSKLRGLHGKLEGMDWEAFMTLKKYRRWVVANTS